MTIKVETVSKSFGKKKVLENLNFEVKKHEIVALLGPNGCGKTTLLNMLSGLTRPDNGNIYIDNDLSQRQKWDKKSFPTTLRT